jgi:hypothetical protein
MQEIQNPMYNLKTTVKMSAVDKIPCKDINECKLL